MTTLVCTDCRHCVRVANVLQPDFYGCERPTGTTSIVTGAPQVLGRKCWSERKPVGWFARLFGDPPCGPEAIYFEMRRTPSPPMKR